MRFWMFDPLHKRVSSVPHFCGRKPPAISSDLPPSGQRDEPILLLLRGLTVKCTVPQLGSLDKFSQRFLSGVSSSKIVEIETRDEAEPRNQSADGVLRGLKVAPTPRDGDGDDPLSLNTQEPYRKVEDSFIAITGALSGRPGEQQWTIHMN